ncbi:PREDICTED: uncharacterized protein LOC105366295 isoform X2 [Ceratosolen solmsi marchali]|nr:PREDICTED: uncharacterized protein LOC105366295 isoform X2 [Ceratosolen solmsi marchali]
MVGKDDEVGDIDDESLARVKLISSKTRQLEETADQVRQDIKNCFERLAGVLRGREKQLLRQVEAIHRQQLSLVQTNSELLPATSNLDADLSTEQQLVNQLLHFGRIDLSNSIAVNDSEPYKVEEYQEAADDYVSFQKSLKSETEEIDVSSILRRKRDTNASSKMTTRNLDNKTVDPETSINYEKISCNESKDNSFTSDATSLPSEKVLQSDNLYLEDKSINTFSCSAVTCIQCNEHSKTADNYPIVIAQEKTKHEGVEHPIQIQQWLQQILAETETEPIIHEIGQFSKIPNTRLYQEFPVET